MANPLDAYVSKLGPRNEIRVERLPKLADLVKEAGLMNGLAKWDNLAEAWRARLERQLMSQQQTTAQVTTTTSTPATVTVSDSGLPAVKADVQALTDALNAHIASKIVHGTVSNVVGLSDEQPLNSKTIGEVAPRNARFNHMIQSNGVPLGEDYTIPLGFNMVVAGPFTIEGSLTILGQIAIVSSS